MKGTQSWNVRMSPPYGGFAPGYWKNALLSHGNKNHASAMIDVDMTDPTKMTQGPGLAALTNGTQAVAVTTTIKHILDIPVSTDLTFAIGSNKLYRLSASTVTNGSADSITWPYTIDKAVVTGEDGESVAYYNGKLYGFYNHSGSAGDILQYDLAGTIDPDWGSTIPTAAATLQNAPHPSIVGGDDVLYFGNGRYVGYYDQSTTTISVDDLDLPVGSKVVDLAYPDSLVWAAVNYPNLSGSNANVGYIYTWRGVGISSWEDQPLIRFNGTIGAIYVKDGRVFVWYQDLSGVSSGGYKLGVVEGNAIRQLRAYSGTLPNFAQRGEYQNMLAWISDGKLHVFGAIDDQLPAFHAIHADGGYATAGALSVPFGTPLISSTDGATNFQLAKFSGYSILSTWKSIVFSAVDSVIDEVRIYYKSQGASARCDVTVSYNQAASSLLLQKSGQTGTLTHANDGSYIFKSFYPKLSVQDFRIDLSWTSGSAANPMDIREIIIFGHTEAKEG